MAAVLVVLLSGLAFAEIPQVISYQGKVTDASGNPIADGTYTMRFVIYDAVSAWTFVRQRGRIRTCTRSCGKRSARSSRRHA